ncbi:MAG TPA: glycoside hydrolase family 16 protein [Gemmatimonadales bacterium]|nr:glycoside hydrolase family 16 protein [Gemmatimonadales bacterium]
MLPVRKIAGSNARHRIARLAWALANSSALLGVFGACKHRASGTTAIAGGGPVWTLVWHDEFNGPAFDTATWTYDIGGSGWGNAELEYYTNRPENAHIANGNLVIEARQEAYGGRNYTSARLKTAPLKGGAWRYGRVEARIKIPRGQGLWPAFWMLGDNIGTVGWPACGEIDIMENIGREPGRVHGTIHGPGYSGAQGIGHPYDLPTGAFADTFHVFAVEWEPNAIRWYVDTALYFTVSPTDVPGTWVFDHPFFIILNVAVGGYWPGNPDSTTVFPQDMLVDYVRVYQRSGI